MNKLETDNSLVGRLLPEDRALLFRQRLPGRRERDVHIIKKKEKKKKWFVDADMALKIPSFTAALTVPVPLSPKWVEKEMTQETSIHRAQPPDWGARVPEATDLTVLSGPCTYILSSSSCLIG